MTKSYAVKMTELHSFKDSDADLTSTRRACRQNSLLHFAHIQHLAEPSKSTRARLGVLHEANPQRFPSPAASPQYDQSKDSGHNESISVGQTQEAGPRGTFSRQTSPQPLKRPPGFASQNLLIEYLDLKWVVGAGVCLWVNEMMR